MKSDLKPFPFCGCEEKFTAEIPTKRGKRYQIICCHCGAKTGRKKTEEEEIAAWNGRSHTEEVISALKKEVAAPVIKEWDKSIGDHSYYRYVCPKCENVLRPSTRGKYCPYCGQRIDWEDESCGK
ncbi:Lar family restriction alleviation protein [Blautia sp. NSJ-175]|uniref:Lar family restriction alleviation protein n=1 Tax=Blautia sp. NSJ-175 TaxID=2931396 RepID=UPI001FD53A8F|nr:Lar family restriction alleviation protein [Blautia sp. NSJ-175]MCJ7848752.1 Lar family restriction alleviation protein [Blautia sp. NSJ-175]DAH02921.1 MAG TPA: restriction alleviation protein [Caudoviricetes sp.]